MSSKRSVGKWVLVAVLGVAAIGSLLFALGGRPSRYKPPYRLSVQLEPEPERGFETPYRTIAVFRAQGTRDKVAAQVISDLTSQGRSWPVSRPSLPDSSYRILDPTEPDTSRAEGITIYADPQRPGTTIVSMASPWRKPSKLQIWRYWLEGFINGQDR